MAPDIDQQQIAREARELFTEWFAHPYRAGRDPLVGPVRGAPEEQGRALIVHEYLVRRGLTVRTNSAKFFRLSDRGKDLAIQGEGLDDALGIRKDPSRSNNGAPFDPTAVRLRAKAIFEEYFRRCDRGLNVSPGEEDERAALQELARTGLAKETRAGGAFLIGPRGVAVCMGEADLDQLLGLAPMPEAPSLMAATIVNNFHAPVGAVAAAPGATANGTVVMAEVDEAMHQVIALQNDLGDLTDRLLPLLRLARKQEQRVASDEDLATVVTDAEEFKDFERAVKPGLSKASIVAARAVLEIVPLLKPALALLGL